jgi:hypothetical protein
VLAGLFLAASVFLPQAFFRREDAFVAWGCRIPFLLSAGVLFAGFVIRREVDETAAFTKEDASGQVARAPVLEAFKYSWPDMLRVVCMAFMNVIPVVTTIFGAAYAVQPSYGINFHASVYLWIPVVGNIVAVLVIPFVGNLSDRIGRRVPIIFGALASGLLSYAYLYAISIHNLPVAFVMSILMWGVVYQGYNAIFPGYYPELFPTRFRVSAMAIAQNIGTTITALLPALFAAVAPPGSHNVPMLIGSITLGVTVISALAAWSARETYRVRLSDLGKKDAVPIPKEQYDQLREEALDEVRLAKAAMQTR